MDMTVATLDIWIDSNEGRLGPVKVILKYFHSMLKIRS